jgi:hypothetical protein
MIEKLIDIIYENGMDCRKFVRRVESGLFIPEGGLPQLAQSIGGQLSRRFTPLKYKDLKNLGEVLESSIDDVLYYQVSGVGTRVGYLLQSSKNRSNIGKIKFERGKLISCRDHLHPHDKLGGIEQVTLYPSRDHISAFNLENGRYLVHNHAFKRFLERAPKSERISETFGNKLKTKRGNLAALYHLFKDSKPIKRFSSSSSRIRQAIKHQCTLADYRENQEWVFVIEDGNLIKTVYDKTACP